MHQESILVIFIILTANKTKYSLFPNNCTFFAKNAILCVPWYLSIDYNITVFEGENDDKMIMNKVYFIWSSLQCFFHGMVKEKDTEEMTSTC